MSTTKTRTIFIWGMPGAGKSTFGRAYALRHQKTWADLDDFIHTTTGASPAAWIRTQGEAAFREVEARLLRELWSLHKPDVIACGGGGPCFHGNAAWMKRRGLTVFLDAPMPLLLKRLSKPGQEDRPLISSGDVLAKRLQEMLTHRRPFYERAHLRLVWTTLEEMIIILDAFLDSRQK